MTTLFRAAVESEASFAKALRKLYKSALDAYVQVDGQVVGCMVACTAVTEALENDAIRGKTKDIFDRVDALVAARIERAITDGDLPALTKARTLSRLATSVLHSLALRARSVVSRRVLDEIASEAVALISAVR